MIRIATFNCENLFSRPKIFSTTKTRSTKLLGLVEELNVELSRSVFNQAKIKELKKKLSYYITIHDIRGKHTKVQGAGDWLGWMEFKRKPADEAAINNVAKVLHSIDSDIVALVEVENRPLLQEFHDEFLYKRLFNGQSGKEYDDIFLIDGNDRRGIDVAIMSRKPVNYLKSQINDRTQYNGKTVHTFSRDCLQVGVQATSTSEVHLLINHFKSMGYSDPSDPQSERRRRGQSDRVAQLLNRFDLQQDYVVVAGDLNSSPEKMSMQPLTKHPELYNVNRELPSNVRGTYRYKTARNQLDYLLVSQALKAKLSNVEIERRGTYTARGPNFPSVTNRKTEASDHGAIVADFSI